jgi:glycosyltransferase involved in cell wall biosynthesis
MFHRALGSLRRQSRRPDEVVIVLDESFVYVKDTRRYIKEAETWDDKKGLTPINWVLRTRGRKEGLAAAKNFGLQFCTGDYITYCDVDDEWAECKLELQSQYATEFPDVSVIGTQAWDRWEDGILRPNCFKPGQFETHEQIRDQLPHENVMCHGSVMIRKESLECLIVAGEGPYRDIRGAEDYDLWKRMMAVGAVFYNIPERLYLYSLGTSVER